MRLGVDQGITNHKVEGGLMKRLLEHPVVAAVLAGLILSALGWFSGVLPSVLSWFINAFNGFLKLITYEINVPVWIFILVGAPIFIASAKVLFKWIFKPPTQSGFSESHAQDSYQAESVERDEVINLSDDQHFVMQKLVALDGSPMAMADFRYGPGLTRLQAEQVVESLCDLEFVQVAGNYLHGDQVYLTVRGRDYMLGNQYSSS